MGTTAALMVLAANFTMYPVPSGPLPRIEALTDKGPIQELIVHCPRGTAIMSYSKLERLYCGPGVGCGTDAQTIMIRACR